MNTFTFTIKHPTRDNSDTVRFTSTSIITATNRLIREKRNHGAVIIGAYVGDKHAKDASRGGYVTYDYLEGKEIAAPRKHSDPKPAEVLFDGLLVDVDQQCSGSPPVAKR